MELFHSLSNFLLVFEEESHKRVFICSAYLLDRDILLPEYSQSTAAIRFLNIGQKLPIIIQTAMFVFNSRCNKVEFSSSISFWLFWQLRNNYTYIIEELLILSLSNLLECIYFFRNFFLDLAIMPYFVGHIKPDE